MQSLGLRGVKRSRQVFTTKSDPARHRPTGLVQRHFRANAPRLPWVVDVTYVRTWQGFAYAAFVTVVFSRGIVGWNVAATSKTDILLRRAVDMAALDAGGDLTVLTHYSAHGSKHMAWVYTDRIAELGAIASTGTVGDSYNNAMAEAINALYKTELIRARGPWHTVERVELATLGWVWWFNNQRFHSELDYRTPTEAKHAYYAGPESVLEADTFREKTQEQKPRTIQVEKLAPGQLIS